MSSVTGVQGSLSVGLRAAVDLTGGHLRAAERCTAFQPDEVCLKSAILSSCIAEIEIKHNGNIPDSVLEISWQFPMGRRKL